MALEAGALALIHPSFIEPELLIQTNQVSGFIDVLAGGQPRIRLEEDDLYIYMKQLNVRTKVAGGTATYNELPGVNISANYIQSPTYKLRTRAEYDHNDTRAASRWGFALPQAYSLGMRQGNYQLARDCCLYGFNPQNGEGIVNAPGALALNLPPDSQGNDTVETYDNGEMAFFMAQEMLAIKTRTYQLGIGREFTWLGPQRTLGLFEYNVVQLVQYQRPGAGSLSSKGTLDAITMPNGDRIKWSYDDTLIGKGANGSDLVILIMPEVEQPKGSGINTNEFAKLQPSNGVCSTMYADMAAPREIISPLAGGATDVLTEWRISPGWAVRPEAVTLISMVFQ